METHHLEITHLSPAEVVCTFSEEAMDIAPRELEKCRAMQKAYIKEFITPGLEKVRGEDRNIIRLLRIAQFPNFEVLSEIRRRIKHLEQIIRLSNAKRQEGAELAIEQARRYSLPQLCEELGIELRQTGSRFVGRCPFHDDRHPSFTGFPDNRWHCFGCEDSGDVIDLVRKIKGLSFKETVKYLTSNVQNED